MILFENVYVLFSIRLEQQLNKKMKVGHVEAVIETGKENALRFKCTSIYIICGDFQLVIFYSSAIIK